MANDRKQPFQSFKFSLIEGRQPRSLLRLTAPESGEFYKLAITRGSASNPLSSTNREVPLQVALDLRDALQEIGVFGWEGSYGDTSAPGSRRWSLAIVFEKDVFSLNAKGGSDVPHRFEELLEMLYKLDFPRPAVKRAEDPEGVGRAIGDAMGALGVNSIGSMNAGDLGAYAATKGADRDYSFLKGMFGAAGMPDELEGFDPESIDAEEAQRLLTEMQRNPEAMQQRMKDEFRHMPADEQNRMLDMLSKMSGRSREWWRRFLQG